MTLVCYFYKPTQDTAGPVLGGWWLWWGGGGGWGWGFSLKHWWIKQQRQKSIFAKVDEKSHSFQASCLMKFACFSLLPFSSRGALYLFPESPVHCDYVMALYHRDWKQRESPRSGLCVAVNLASSMCVCVCVSSPLSALQPFLFYLINTIVHVGISFCVLLAYWCIGVPVSAAVTQSWLKKASFPSPSQDPSLPLASLSAVYWYRDTDTSVTCAL